MENLTQLFIHTPWRQAHRWDIDENGLVDYDGVILTPREAYEDFKINYTMFDILCAEVCERITIEDSEKPYRWVTLERLDK